MIYFRLISLNTLKIDEIHLYLTLRPCYEVLSYKKVTKNIVANH